MVDQTNGKLTEAIRIARQRKDFSLIRCLKDLRFRERIEHEERKRTCETYIANDFAPLSFCWGRKINDQWEMNGGIIFHGKHDGFGSGSAPSFSVSITPTNGWQIHT